MAEIRAQSSAKLSELQLPETAMELAAADFAESAISVADVSNLLTDDDESVADAAVADALNLDEIEQAANTDIAAVTDFHPDDIMLEDELPELDAAGASEPESSDEALLTASLSSDEPQEKNLNDAELTDIELLNAEFSESASPDLVADDTEQQLAKEALAEAEYLSEFAELETLDMPDLETNDDNSVAKFEPPSSVERPSQLLDSYPELEMNDDGDLIFEEDDFASNSVVDVDELLRDTEQPLDMSELNELDDTNFDELLSELAEVELPDDDLLMSSVDEHLALDPSLEDELLNASDISLPHEVPELPDFVNIDRLLAATDDEQATQDPSARLNIDVGLADFDDLILPEEAGDVDATDNGFAGKMDLVRAYIEIGDGESANQLIKDIMASDAPAHVKQEALSLQS